MAFSIDQIQSIGVLGSGVMGHGIGLVGAQAGLGIILYDVTDTALQKARQQIEAFTQNSVEKGKLTAEARTEILNRITYTANLEEVKAQLIVEATPENLDLKQKLFSSLEAMTDPQTILATNTSSIPVTQIAAGLQRPQNVIGWHFFNPAPLMKLVEVIAGEETDPQLVETTVALTKKVGKVPACVKDTPGFIVNRVARTYYLESLRMLEEGVATVEDIDAIMEGVGFRMGPFKLMDLIGIETNHEVTKSIYNSFYHEARFRPSRIQQKKVEARRWGKKTGKGFYDYSK